MAVAGTDGVESFDSSFQIISTMRYDPELPQRSLPPTYPQPQDSPYYLLRYHHERLVSAARDMQWESAIARLEKDKSSTNTSEGPNIAELEATLDANIPDRSRTWRLRVLLDRDGHITVETSPAPSSSSSLAEHPLLVIPTAPTFSSLAAGGQSTTTVWTLRLDSQPTPPSAFTRHKTTRRGIYSAARERAGIASPSEPVEALMYNPRGEVMDGSITTVYFKQKQTSEDDDEKEDREWVTPALSSGGNAGTTRRYALATGLCTEGVVRVDELADGEQAWVSNGFRGFMPAAVQIPQSQ